MSLAFTLNWGLIHMGSNQMYTNKEKEDAEFFMRCCVFGLFALIGLMFAVLLLAIMAGGAT